MQLQSFLKNISYHNKKYDAQARTYSIQTTKHSQSPISPYTTFNHVTVNTIMRTHAHLQLMGCQFWTNALCWSMAVCLFVFVSTDQDWAMGMMHHEVADAAHYRPPELAHPPGSGDDKGGVFLLGDVNDCVTGLVCVLHSEFSLDLVKKLML